jgi:hypothetical protein
MYFQCNLRAITGFYFCFIKKAVMKKISVILIALILCTAPFAVSKASPDVKATKVASEVSADSDLITGKVTDKNTNEALAGAVVVCGDQKAYTDLDGNFTIRKTKKASELIVCLISYNSITLQLNQIQDKCVSISLCQR